MVLLVDTIDTARLVPVLAQLFVEVSYGYIRTSFSFVSTQAWFRQAFCCTYGTRRKYLSPGLDTLWPLILQPAWLASTSINSSNPQVLPGFARIRCLLQDCACATLFVETSRCQVKFSRFSALARTCPVLSRKFPQLRANTKSVHMHVNVPV